jgi:hypothetical protein
MKWVGLLVLVVLVAGCADPKIVPLLGNWTGSFKAESVDGRKDVALLKATDFKAYLQLYRTKDRFKMRMENPLQAVEVTGSWSRKGDQILLAPAEFKFENPSEEAQKTKNMRIVQPQEMREGYGKSFALDISPDSKSLSSPTMTLGIVTGRHFFTKGVSSDYAEREYERMRGQK